MGRQDVEDDNIYLLNVDGEMKEIAPGTADGIYNNQWKSDEECEGYWGEKRLTFTQNKSMTNKLQDWNNNYLYGRDVEYILYDGKKLVCLSYSDYLRLFVTIQYRSKHLLLRP